jgi:hypothetical protein
MPAQAVFDRLTATAVAAVPEAQKSGPLIDIITQLLPILLPLLIGCFKPPAPPAKAVEAAQNPGPFRIAMLNLHIWREMPDRATYREIGPVIASAVLAAGKQLTESDVNDVLAG